MIAGQELSSSAWADAFCKSALEMGHNLDNEWVRTCFAKAMRAAHLAGLESKGSSRIIHPVVPPMPLHRRLVAALGVRSPWQKVVVEMDGGSCIKVYAAMLAEESEIERVCDEIEGHVVADVTVDEKGNVEVTQ